MNKVKFILILFCFDCAITGCSHFTSIEKGRNQDFKIVKEANLSTGAEFELEGPHGQRVFIKQEANIDNAKFVRYVNTTKNYFYGLFAGVTEPYFGKTDSLNECILLKNIDASEVITNGRHSIFAFDLPATENFIYGACNGNGSYYQSILTLVHCRDSNMYFRVKYFFRNFKNFISSPEYFCEEMPNFLH